ncbi:MAG: hypothetical protein ACI3Y9_02960 [Candidatus Cryptobacteroides sp.]
MADKKYKWEFSNIGGASRVKINSGEDIAHLGELDPTMWTVLSCPVQGLEIDSASLACIDTDGDGKIRVNDVVKTAEWAVSALTNADRLLEGASSIAISEFNPGTGTGSKLASSAREILQNLGREGDVISLSDTADRVAIFAGTKFNGDGIIIEATSGNEDEKAVIAAIKSTLGTVKDRSGEDGVNAELIEAFYKELAEYSAWCAAKPELPYGDDTEALLSAYQSLDAKVRDFFVRSKVAAFSPDNAAKLDVQTAWIEAIAGSDLASKLDEIAGYPLARITGKAEIPVDAAVNPVWVAQFATVAKLAVPEGVEAVDESLWNEIGAKLAPYIAWKAAKAGAAVESLGIEAVDKFLASALKQSLLDLVAKDLALKEEAENIDNVDKFLHVYRDFYKLLRNFVTLEDFYSKDKNVKAIFQSGTLIIDQRACRFCMNVADMAKHNTMAPASGMYLVYCDCTTKTKPGKITIVAAVTVGDIGDLAVGKNAVYYDNQGLEWDAVITKIIDNPISISQSFWSPYRRMSDAVQNLINKSAAEKDAKLMKDATDKINAAPAAAPASPDAKPAPAQPFDIGKFAGIFAALGMAVGMIGSALASLVKGFVALKWWQVILAFVGILLVISGPAMVLAWMKLRKRNIAPLLNANGWAVNASAKISIGFGETLTDIAKFPKLKLKDPYAKKGLPLWGRILIWLLTLAVIAGGAAAAYCFWLKDLI